MWDRVCLSGSRGLGRLHHAPSFSVILCSQGHLSLIYVSAAEIKCSQWWGVQEDFRLNMQMLAKRRWPVTHVAKPAFPGLFPLGTDTLRESVQLSQRVPMTRPPPPAPGLALVPSKQSRVGWNSRRLDKYSLLPLRLPSQLQADELPLVYFPLPRASMSEVSFSEVTQTHILTGSVEWALLPQEGPMEVRVCGERPLLSVKAEGPVGDPGPKHPIGLVISCRAA